MVCLECHLHGKRVHHLSPKTGEEHAFVTSTSQVFPKTCEVCRDPKCLYNFNMPKLLRYKKLRKKVLKHIFDASFDDMLFEYGISYSHRSVPILYEMEEDVSICSKPTYTKKNSRKLLKLDKETIRLRENYFKSIDDYNTVLKKTKKCPKRVIIERKDR